MGHFYPPKSRSVSRSRDPIKSGSIVDDPDPQQLVAVKCGKPLLFLTSIKFENKDLPRVRRLEALWNICGEVSETAKTLTISKISSAYILKLQLHRGAQKDVTIVCEGQLFLGSIYLWSRGICEQKLFEPEDICEQQQLSSTRLLFVRGSCLWAALLCTRQLFESGRLSVI